MTRREKPSRTRAKPNTDVASCHAALNGSSSICGITRGRTGSLLDIAAVTSRCIESAIMGRNEGLPVSHLAEALLDIRPFEEPSAALSQQENVR